MGFRVWGLGFRTLERQAGFRIQGGWDLGFRITVRVQRFNSFGSRTQRSSNLPEPWPVLRCRVDATGSCGLDNLNRIWAPL